ncbi:MAG: hypothetical protein U0Q55_15260 [Vicinamibacterales bacterium]
MNAKKAQPRIPGAVLALVGTKAFALAFLSVVTGVAAFFISVITGTRALVSVAMFFFGLAAVSVAVAAVGLGLFAAMLLFGIVLGSVRKQ